MDSRWFDHDVLMKSATPLLLDKCGLRLESAELSRLQGPFWCSMVRSTRIVNLWILVVVCDCACVESVNPFPSDKLILRLKSAELGRLRESPSVLRFDCRSMDTSRVV